MSVKYGVMMKGESKSALQDFHDRISGFQRKLMRLYLQYVNPKLARMVEVLSEPKDFLHKLLPTDIVKWLTVAAATTGVAIFTMPETFWNWQLVLFLGIFLLGPVVCQMLQGARATFYNLLVAYPGKHLLQQVITLESPIVEGKADVVLHGESWQLRGDDCPAGSRVRVIAIKDNVLFVSPADRQDLL